MPRIAPRPGGSRDYKRGAIMGLTVAEAFILLAFCLLLLFTWWQVDTEKRSITVADRIGELTEQQKQDLVAGLSDGTFDLARTLREAGIVGGERALAETSQYSRFMREEDLKRLMQATVELSPDTRLTLADAVEVTPEAELRDALRKLATREDNVEQASRRLAEAAATQDRAVAMLDRALGQDIRAAGGQIDGNGTITLPQNVLFDPGSDRIRNLPFLRDFCTAWIGTLRDSGLDIANLKIEGHASSEGRPGETPEQAYLSNLDLSQRRAQNALTTCLNGIRDPRTLAWAREHLSAAGYSSARPVVQADGSEDREKSRRVMFAMDVDREALIDGIREDLTSTPPALP